MLRLSILGGLIGAVPSLGCDSSGHGERSVEAHDAGVGGTDSSRWGGYDGSGGGARDAGAWGGDPEGDPDRNPKGAADAGIDAGPDAGDRCALRETREPVLLYLSADDSSSMASPVIARWELESGRLPSARYLRTYEFLNYYDVDYPDAEPGHVRIVPEARNAEEEGQVVLQVGLQAPPPPLVPRARVITLVIDRSGSMSGRPIDLERVVVRAIAGSLRAGDVVSAVEWNTERTVRLDGHRVTGRDDPALLSLASSLEADGGTDLNSALVYGYELARAHYDADKLNRVVLISDGQANVGITASELIAVNAEDAEEEGIFLVGVGVGNGYDDTLMDDVTDAGRGAYVFIDSDAEAERVFGPRFDEVMEVSLMNVRLELTLPWYWAVVQFHGEEISTDPTRVWPQHLAPGDAMVFHQVLEACDLAELYLEDPIRTRATYVRPDGRVEADDVVDTTLAALVAADSPGLRRGDAIVAYAEALAVAASGASASSSDAPTPRAALTEAQAMVAAANPIGTDADLNEISHLIDLALIHFPEP